MRKGAVAVIDLLILLVVGYRLSGMLTILCDRT